MSQKSSGNNAAAMVARIQQQQQARAGKPKQATREQLKLAETVAEIKKLDSAAAWEFISKFDFNQERVHRAIAEEFECRFWFVQLRPVADSRRSCAV